MVKALSSCRASTRARARFSNEARSIDLIDRSLNGYRGRQNGGGDASKASALVFRRDAISSSAVRMSRGNESFDHALAEFPLMIFVPVGGTSFSDSRTLLFERSRAAPICPAVNTPS